LEQAEVQGKVIEKQLDQVAAEFAQKIGYDSVPWFKLTVQLIYLYSAVTIFVMFLRPDFLNLTICVTALYMLNNLEMITKGKFRVLVLGVFLSLIYDLIWFYIKHSEYTNDADGSNETGMRKFSLIMSYASFLLRVSYFYLNFY